MSIILNDSPILLKIALHCDAKTLFNFMLVNRKCYSVFKHILRNAPTVFIASYQCESSGELPSKIIYNSLKELFTELHKFELENPKKVRHYLTGKFVPDINNLSGPCNCCIEEADKYDPSPYYPDYRYYHNLFCFCDDIHYGGIRMVKYISNESSAKKVSIVNSYKPNSYYCSQLSTLDNTIQGFRLSMTLNNIYEEQILTEPDALSNTNCCTQRILTGLCQGHNSDQTNYKSIEYLFRGCKKFSFLFKNGIQKRNLNKMKYFDMYYPATTDILYLVNFVYLPRGKADFNHGLCLVTLPPISETRRINTI
jgi:hypothetical protein